MHPKSAQNNIWEAVQLGRELHKVITTCACEDSVRSIYQAKAYLSNQNTAFCQNITPLRKQPILAWFCSQGPLICTSPQVPLWTCVSVCTCVCERRAGPTSLARWSLMADEWHSRCLSIFSSKHPWQAGRRGSWEHEVVQRWTVDFQFNWLSWKVKRLCSRQCQHTAVSLCRLGFVGSRTHFVKDFSLRSSLILFKTDRPFTWKSCQPHKQQLCFLVRLQKSISF